MSLQIITGKIKKPIKVVLYGVEGIGKTTLASKFPTPIFIDTENGTKTMNVQRINPPQTWDELIQDVRELKEYKDYETLVIDSADWAEQLAIKKVLEVNRITSIESLAYGKAYTLVADEFKTLISELDAVIENEKNVVLVAHAKVRKYELPDEMGSFDKYELTLTRQTAPIVKQWCDLLLFCNYKTLLVNDVNGKKKATGGKRVMYTNHAPTWDAKNRFDLPDELDLCFDSIKHLFSDEQTQTKVEEKPTTHPMQNKARVLMEKDGVTDEQLRQVVVTRKMQDANLKVEEYPETFWSRWVIPNWEKIKIVISSQANIGGNENARQ